MNHMTESLALLLTALVWGGFLCVRFAPRLRLFCRAFGERARTAPARAIMGMLAVGIAVAYAGTKPINTLVFDFNDGTGNVDSQKYPIGKEFPLKEVQCERSGYELAGWCSNRNCGVEWAVDESDVMLSSGPTTRVYAAWVKNDHYAISFDPGDGDSEMEYMQVPYNAVTNLPVAADAFTRKGQKLVGWRHAHGDAKIFDTGILVFNLLDEVGVYDLEAVWEDEDK